MAISSVSVVITTYNSQKYIELVLQSVFNQTMKPDEIIVVDDGSTDNTIKLIPKNVKLVTQENRGPAGASNRAIKEASGDIIVSVDSDAVLFPTFIEKAVRKLLSDKSIGAVSGYISTANEYNFWARIMGYDLEYRYDRIEGREPEVSHASPNNTVYRREVFDNVGYFNEKYYYAQDVDFSYRMLSKGYKIILLKETGCMHYWKESFWKYTKQQFHSAYWRMKLIRKKPINVTGDSVSGFWMMMQVPITGLFILSCLLSIWFNPFIIVATTLLTFLLIERYVQAVMIVIAKNSYSMMLMPFVHLWRNAIWGIATITYLVKPK